MRTFNNLTDEEFLNLVDIEQDPLTTSDTQVELARRLQAALEEAGANAPLLDVLGDQGTEDVEVLRGALVLADRTSTLMEENKLADPDALETALATATELRELLEEHGLADLATLAKELDALDIARWPRPSLPPPFANQPPKGKP